MVDKTFARFLANGLAATLIHYATLSALIEIVGLGSAGLANGLASVVGIAASYVGNRVFVFRSTARHGRTLPLFLILYSVVALLHAGVLLVWTDLAGLRYGFGFLLATGASVAITFLANRYLIFREPPDVP